MSSVRPAFEIGELALADALELVAARHACDLGEGRADRQRGQRGEVLGDLARCRFRIVGYAMHDTSRQRLLGRHAPAGEQYVGANPLRKAAPGAPGAPARKIAPLDLRQGQMRTPRHDPQVARERQLEAATHRGVLDGGDHRQGKRRDAVAGCLGPA